MVPEMVEQGGQVVLESARLPSRRVIGITMSAEVEGDDVKTLGESRCHCVPPVRVGAAAVEQHQRHSGRIAPVQGVEGDAVERRSAEPFGAHGRGRRSIARPGSARIGPEKAVCQPISIGSSA